MNSRHLYNCKKTVFFISVLLIVLSFFLTVKKVSAQEETYKLQSSILIPWGYGNGQIPSPGNGPGLFKIDTNGNIYIYCYDNKQHTLIEFDSKGNELNRIILPCHPDKFNLDEDGLFMVWDLKNEALYIDKNLTAIKKIDIPQNFKVWKENFENGVVYRSKGDVEKGPEKLVFDKTKWEKSGKPSGRKFPQVEEHWENGDSQIVFLSKEQSAGVTIFHGGNHFLRSLKIIGIDKYSNAYVRISYEASLGALENSTVIKVSPDGNILSLFEIKPNDVVDGFCGSWVIPMDVDVDGNVYRLRTSNEGIYIDKLISD